MEGIVSYILREAPAHQRFWRLAHVAFKCPSAIVGPEEQDAAVAAALRLLLSRADVEQLREFLVQAQSKLRSLVVSDEEIQRVVAASQVCLAPGGDIGPVSVDVLLQLSRKYRERGNVDDAISCVSRALAVCSSWEEEYRVLCEGSVLCMAWRDWDSRLERHCELLRQLLFRSPPDSEVALHYLSLKAVIAFTRGDFALAAWQFMPENLSCLGLLSIGGLRSVVQQYFAPPAEFALMIFLSAVAALPRDAAMAVTNGAALQSLMRGADDVRELAEHFVTFEMGKLMNLQLGPRVRIGSDALLAESWESLYMKVASAVVAQEVGPYSVVHLASVSLRLGVSTTGLESIIRHLVEQGELSVRIDSVAQVIHRKPVLLTASAATRTIRKNGDRLISRMENSLLSYSLHQGDEMTPSS